MSTSMPVKFLPNVGRALRRAMQWRLLLWWVLLTLIPTLALLLPVWQTLSSALDNTVHAAEWAQHWDVMMLGDLATASMALQGSFAGATLTTVVLLFVMIPLLNGIFIAAARSETPLHMGQLLREGVTQYWKMFRMMLMALLPIALALLVARLGSRLVDHYGESAVLESKVDHLQWAVAVVVAIVFAYANSTVDAGRASLALEPTRRSAIKAWWRGLKFATRHFLRSVILYLAITALAALALSIALLLRIHLHSASFTGLVVGLLLAQLTTAILGWMHYARLFGMVELTLALKPAAAA